MGTPMTIEEAKEALLKIVRERDGLRMELAYAKTAIVELENQNIDLDQILTTAYSHLSEYDPKRFSAPASKGNIGLWLSSPAEYPGLLNTENLWRNGHIQQALSQMPALLGRKDLGVAHQVNAMLLHSAIIQSSSQDFKAALHWAEAALQVASKDHLHELAGKAQFHRGLCYYHLSEYANAQSCLLLASHLEDHAQLSLELRQRAKQYLEELPAGDPKRSPSPGFRLFCHSQIDKFVYNES